MKMVAEIFIIFAVTVVSNAVPVWIVNHPVPSAFLTNGPIPNIVVQELLPQPFHLQSNQKYASAVSSAKNGLYGSAISAAQTKNGYQTAFAAAQGNRVGWAQTLNNYNTASSFAQNFKSPYAGTAPQFQHGPDSTLTTAQSNAVNQRSNQQATSLAQTFKRPGFASTLATASNTIALGSNSAMSTAQNAGDYETAISVAQQQTGQSSGSVLAETLHGPFRASVAESLQKHGNSFQKASTNAVNALGFQAAN